MEDTITQFGGWAGLIATFIFGIFWIIQLIDKKRKERLNEVDNADDRLIDLLKGTVDELEKKVNQQTLDIKALTDKVDTLEKENETLVKVLQGRDDQTQKFYKDAYAMMEVIKHNDKVSEENSKILSKISSILEILIKK